jgi:hypothetical protein
LELERRTGISRYSLTTHSLMTLLFGAGGVKR